MRSQPNMLASAISGFYNMTDQMEVLHASVRFC